MLAVLGIFLALALPWSYAETNLCLLPSSDTARPLLYRVEKDERVAHILGTLHAGLPLTAMPPEVFRLIDGASVGVTESFERRWLKHMMRCLEAQRLLNRSLPSDPLSAQLSKKDYGRLVARLNERGFPSSVAFRFTSAGATFALDDGPEREHGRLDAEILRRLHDRGIPIAALESEREELSIVKRAYTLDHLRKILSRPDDVTAKRCEMYWHGDENALRSEANAVDPADPFIRAVLLERNQAWAERIDRLVRREPRAFFFFTGSHLFGEGGVLNLLRRQGYSVNRVD